MEQTARLTFTSFWTIFELNDPWQKCFAGAANYEHMNRYVPHPLTAQGQLNNFMQNSGKGYTAWIIKRRKEIDPIGFVIHGDFFPGHPNNIGFNVGLNYSRQGYAVESLISLMNLLENSGYTETYDHCFATNVASFRCMENCGFQNLGPTGKKYGNDVEIQFRKRFDAFGAG